MSKKRQLSNGRRRKKAAFRSRAVSVVLSFFRVSSRRLGAAGYWALHHRSLMLVMIACALVSYAWVSRDWILTHSVDHEVSKIEVNGYFQHLSKHELEGVLAPWIGRSFLTTDLIVVKNRLEGNPWIKHVVIRRKWPGVLSVEIREQLPVSSWNDSAYLNPYGKIFRPRLASKTMRAAEVKNSSMPAQLSRLPRLSGPDAKAELVLTTYGKMRETLKRQGINLDGMHLKSQGEWELIINGDTTVEVGRKPFEAVATLVSMFKKMTKSEQANVLRMDMRYQGKVSIARRDRAA